MDIGSYAGQLSEPVRPRWDRRYSVHLNNFLSTWM